MGNSATIRVGAPGASKASSEIDQLRDRFSKLQAQSAKGLVSGVAAGVTVKALGLVGDAVGNVTGFLEDSVHAYQNAEESQARLTQSLRENVADWDGSTKAVDAAITASEKFGFTNTDTADSLALLVGATHDQAKAINMLGVAQDYARYKNIGLLQAATDLTKVEGGSTRALKALGINLKTGATETERMGAIMKVVGGQAAAYADTDLGKLAAANEKVNEAQVKFGKGLSHLEAVILPAAADAVANLGTQLDDLSVAFDGNQTPADRLRATADALRNSIIGSAPGVKEYAKALDDQAAALDATQKATQRDSDARRAHADALDADYVAAKEVIAVEVDVAAAMKRSSAIGTQALADEAAEADKAAAKFRNYKSAVLDAFKAAQDAARAKGDTKLQIDQKLDELAALDKQFMRTTHVVTAAQKGEWALRRKIIEEEIGKEEAILSKSTSTALQRDRARLALDKLRLQLSKLGGPPASSTKQFTARELEEYKLQRQQLLADLRDLQLQMALVGDNMHKEVALAALLTSKDMKAGLTSKDDDIRSSYEALKAHILDNLGLIKSEGGPAAAAAAKAILAGLGSVGKVAGGVDVQFTLKTGRGPVQNLAEGGIVKAKPGGTIVRVAEAGHDEAVVPLSGPSAPRLSPLPGGFGGSGGGVTVNVYLPNAYGMTPGQGEALGRVIAPHVAKALQRSGHLAPARAF